jgi:galactokinase
VEGSTIFLGLLGKIEAMSEQMGEQLWASGGESSGEFLRQLFRERVGGEAEAVVFAPGRVNLIGEHTDYNGGWVLPMAIELGIYVVARGRSDGRVRLWSEDFPGEAVEFEVRLGMGVGEPGWSNYVRGVLAGMIGAGVKVGGFDAVIWATLPRGGGLSSSAALEVATATLVELFAGERLDLEEKAFICQKAEHDFAGTPCGMMDQFAVVFGKRGHFVLIDCRSMERTLVPMLGEDVALMVINTMVRHELTDGGYRSRREDCEEAARLLGVSQLREVGLEAVAGLDELLSERLAKRARHVITENARTLKAVEALGLGQWEELGELMWASHRSLRDDFNVSCAELDLVVEEARKLGVAGGVYGCRMTGGGFGGCCIALVARSRVAEVREWLGARYLEETGMEATIFVTRPADGATVLFP